MNARILAVLLLASAASAQIIPANRLFDWGRWTGVEGGIRTNRSTIAAVLLPPSSAGTINSAILAAPSNSVVLLAPGTFVISSVLNLQKSGVTLRGSGRGLTRLALQFDGSVGIRLGGPNYQYDFSSSVAFNISGAVQGATIISAPGNTLTIGDYCRIDQLEDNQLIDVDGNSGHCGWCGRANGARPFAQVVKVTGRQGDNVSFEPPLAYFYTQTPQIVRWGDKVEWVGVENMTITNGLNSSSTAADNLFYISGAANCWIYGCEIAGADNRQLWCYDMYRCEARMNHFAHATGPDFDPVAYAPSHGYGIFLGMGCSFNKIEDNSSDRLHYFAANEGAGCGNVFAYNFCTNIMYGSDRVTPQPAIGNHGAHPQFGLWEGNIFRSKILMDSYWGSASHTTIFRNRIAIPPVIGGGIQSQYAIDIDIWKQQQFHNIVGNTLGTPGMEDSYFIPDGASVNEGGNQFIIGLGRPDANNTSLAAADPRVANTVIIKANWNSVDNSIHAGEATSEPLPPSFLYMSKPAFWGTNAWPSIGPDIYTDHPFLPAEYRFRHNGSLAYLGAGGGGGGVQQLDPPTTTISFGQVFSGSVRVNLESPTNAMTMPLLTWRVEETLGTNGPWVDAAFAPVLSNTAAKVFGSVLLSNVPLGLHNYRASANMTNGQSGPLSAVISTNLIGPQTIVSVLTGPTLTGPWTKLLTIPPMPPSTNNKFYKVEATKQ